MQTTVDIDDELLAQAWEFAPGLTISALIEAGLRAFVQREAARRLAGMVGTQPDLALPPRRKMLWRVGPITARTGQDKRHPCTCSAG